MQCLFHAVRVQPPLERCQGLNPDSAAHVKSHHDDCTEEAWKITPVRLITTVQGSPKKKIEYWYL